MIAEPAGKRSCAEVSDKLSDFHDGRFPPGSAEAEDIESHLAVCPSCAEMLDDFRALSAAARLLRQTASCERDVECVRAAVERSLRKLGFVRRLAWTGFGLSAAAAAAALVAALVLEPRGAAKVRGPSVEESAFISPQGLEAGAPEGLDMVEASVRAELERALLEARIFGEARPSEWMAIHEEARLRRPSEESLFRSRLSQWPGARHGVITVSSDGR